MMRIALICAVIMITGGILTACSDPCSKTDAEDFEVHIKLIAHGLPTAVGGEGAKVDIHTEKRPCGASVKGKFDFGHLVDSNGEFESLYRVGYNLRNTKDEIYISYKCPGLGSGAVILTYDDLKPYAGTTYVLDLNTLTSVSAPSTQVPPTITLGMLQEMYKKNEGNFLFCQDLPYALLHGIPQSGSGADKAELYEELDRQGYDEVKRGYIASECAEVSFIQLEDGDVVMFGFDDYPDVENAQHYAVAFGGQLWQIAHWGGNLGNPMKGILDGPRDPEWFFSERALVSPFTGEERTSPRVYQYYRIWRCQR